MIRVVQTLGGCLAEASNPEFNMAVVEQDFSFVGDWATTVNPYQDRQLLINWYPEIDPNKAAKVVISLLGCPGLLEVANVADAS